MAEATTSFKIILISLLILFGSINTIAYKFQNQQLVFEGPFYKYFFHPYMQTTTMFFGQSFALLVFYIKKRRDPQTFKMKILQAKSKGKEIKFNKLLLIIPAASDLITSTLVYIALCFVPGSVYQMMRGGSIVSTFLFSIGFLKMKAQRFQVVGSALALIGIIIVGMSNLIFSSGSADDEGVALHIIGYILLITSLVTNGFLFVYQEKLLSKYHIEPLQIVGYEGLFGLAMQALILVGFNFIPCSFGINACSFNNEGQAFLQRPSAYFAQAFSNGGLLFFCILGTVSISTFNVLGVTVTKHINAIARSISDVSRTVVVWVIGIIITATAGANWPNYKWQLIDGGAISIQLVGFVILIFGNLIYNRMIKVRFLQPKEIRDKLLDEQVEETPQPFKNSEQSLLTQKQNN